MINKELIKELIEEYGEAMFSLNNIMSYNNENKEREQKKEINRLLEEISKELNK